MNKGEKNLKEEMRKVGEESAFGMARREIINLYHSKERVVKLFMIITGIIALLLSDVLVGFVVQSAGDQEYDIISLMLSGFHIVTLIIAVVIWMFVMHLFYRIYDWFYKGRTIDEEKNVVVAAEGSSGTAIQLTKEDKKEAFSDSETFAEQKNNILGTDVSSDPDKDNHYNLYSVKPGYGINGNMMIMGSPGSGKSRCFIIPWIFQTIRRGESLIITDPKGELYGKTAEVARAHGYTVKIFNVNPRQMLHSDSCNFMSAIGDDDFMIDSFVSTIMANISGTAEVDFWNKSQLNELKFITTYIATNDQNIPKTLGGIFQFMNTMSVEELEDFFFNLPEDHPAKPAFNTWQQGDKTVKGNTHAGLQIDLQKLANKQVQKITGEDDIDFTLPGKEKCIYYVAMSDQDRSMSFLVALFFTILYQELVNYADGRKARRLKVKVTMLLDEFYNIGLIPDFDSKISQVRSRGIDTIIVLQSLGQLQKMYPDNVWESIIDCCSTMILLATRSLLTADYFSKYSGDQTVVTRSYRFEENAGDLVKAKFHRTVTETTTQRPLYTTHEIITKPQDRILVSTSTFNMAELKKVDYSKHPMCQEIREVVASEHIPKWVTELTDEEAEKFHVDREKFVPEGGWDIQLCTEEDFKHPWTSEKEKELQKKIIEEQKRTGRYFPDDDDDDCDRLHLAEDNETEYDYYDNAVVNDDVFYDKGIMPNVSKNNQNSAKNIYERYNLNESEEKPDVFTKPQKVVHEIYEYPEGYDAEEMVNGMETDEIEEPLYEEPIEEPMEEDIPVKPKKNRYTAQVSNISLEKKSRHK